MLEILFPLRCPVCGDIVVPKGRKVCCGCQEAFVKVKEPRCKKCSKPIQEEEIEYCYDCSKKEFHYIQGGALWIYDHKLRNSIAAFKYGGRREYGAYYTQELIRNFGGWLLKIQPDALIPVPLHKVRQRQRGFNQAAVLALNIGRELAIPVLEGILIRGRNTLPQKELNDRERLANLIKAFQISDGKKTMLESVKKAVLIDDIYTTGSTIEACAMALQKAGVQKIYFLTLCIGKGY